MMQPGSKRAFFWLIAGLALILFLYAIKAILLPFVVGMLTAYFLDPSADRLERAGLSRTMATGVITVTFFSVVILLLVALVPLLSQQIIELVGMLPEYARDLSERYSSSIQHLLQMVKQEGQLDNVKNALGNISGVMVNLTGDVVSGVFHSGIAFLNLLSLLLITPVVAFYLLRDWDRLVAAADALLPRQQAQTIRQQLREIDRTIGGFLHGQFSVMLILAAFYGIGLTLAGLRFGLVVGIASGLLVIIPYLGAAFGMVMAVGLALLQFDDFNRVLIVLGIYVAGQVMEGNFITPKLVGEKVGLHPVWLIFGLLAGGALFGFVGVLIAVPVTAVIGVLTRFALTHYLYSPLYRGDLIPPPET